MSTHKQPSSKQLKVNILNYLNLNNGYYHSFPTVQYHHHKFHILAASQRSISTLLPKLQLCSRNSYPKQYPISTRPNILSLQILERGTIWTRIVLPSQSQQIILSRIILFVPEVAPSALEIEPANWTRIRIISIQVSQTCHIPCSREV